ncbi:hypothetical protein K0U91_04435 [Chryseobacterium chendengshani]|uniref:hypothetical protein n=1 Tax=Chryseobacterium sp. LJ668 TaxID=2864040 RepID=UPI001C68BC4A|nr:hypothetical protein [Chryseobacterium sp. LJ668]MBW8524660.1 hypothetical protein [Chryseobacterium sp. LJ668]QYK17383.1 hypothetical protein K0U91_04435 [Chryseobacterium sp. LJ668]
MKNLIVTFCYIFLLQSCKKEISKQDYIKVIQGKETNTTIIYKNGKLVSSEVFDKKYGYLDSKYLYKDESVIKIYKYYPDKKLNSYSYLFKAPHNYTTVVYYKNGKISSEGEGDYFKANNLYLKRGEWIFYNKSGKPFSIYGFMHDGKKQYIKREILFDTITGKIKKDTIFNPPFLVENGGFVPIN